MTTTKTAQNPASPRTLKARENQQKRLARIRELIDIANARGPYSAARIQVARLELIMTVSRAIAYHDGGKIEGLHSLDTACANNSFCPRMQASDDPHCICSMCYTKSLWESATAAHYITGLILSEVLFTVEEAATVAIPALMLRFNSDGELINTTHAINLVRIAKTHPATTCALWTKRPGLLNSVIHSEGKPANLIIGVSSPMINAPFREIWTWCDFIFTVYTPRGLEAALARGEYPCNGQKCIACGFHCYRHHDTTNGPVYVAEMLRKPRGMTNAQFAAVVAAIDATTLDK